MSIDYDSLDPFDGDHDWFGKPNLNGHYIGRAFLRSLADMPGAEPQQGDIIYWNATTRKWVYAQMPPFKGVAVLGGDAVAVNSTWMPTPLSLPIEVGKHYLIDIWMRATIIASTLEIRLDLPTGASFVGTYQSDNNSVGNPSADEKVWNGTTSISSSTESVADGQWVRVQGLLYGATIAENLIVEVRASSGAHAGIMANSMMTVVKQN